MELKDYLARAMRTAKELDTLGENLVHAALGIGSETDELTATIACAWMGLPFNVDNIPEEIGDACWFAALMCYKMDWKFEDMIVEPGDASEMSQPLAAAVIGRNPVAICMMANVFAGEILTIVKAHVIYNKELDSDLLRRNLSLFVTTMSLLSNIHDIPFESYTLARNIDKLKARYPDKYSDVAALERMDKRILTSANDTLTH